MPRISEIRRNAEGQVLGAQLDDGRIFTMEQVIQEAKRGKIDGVFVDTDRQGREYLRVRPEDAADTLS